ncbi:glycosyltransferase family 39 protein [Dermacoccaceae bacterium W4C1]
MQARHDLRAAAAFVAVHAAGVLVLATVLGPTQAWSRLHARWDSLWYSRIADHGYDVVVRTADGRSLSAQAFYPLLPGIERLGGELTGLAPSTVGVVVAWVSGAVAAVLIARIGRHLFGARVGLLTAVLWAALPIAMVEVMGYSESLFTALAAGCLLALLHQRWWIAGWCCAAAGLTRPTGMAVLVALVVAVALTAREPSSGDETRRTRLSRIGAVAVGVCGVAAHPLAVALARGDLLGYPRVQAGWGNGFDAGWSFARAALPPALAVVAVLAFWCLVAWAGVAMRRSGQPWFIVAYALVVVVTAMGASGFFGSKPRLLIPAFPVLLWLALIVHRRAPRWAVAMAGTVVASSLVLNTVLLSGNGPP